MLYYNGNTQGNHVKKKDFAGYVGQLSNAEIVALKAAIRQREEAHAEKMKKRQQVQEKHTSDCPWNDGFSCRCGENK